LDGLPVIDSAAISALKGLRRPTDKVDFFSEIVGLFLLNTPQVIQALEKGVKENDADQIVSAAHRLKGSAANIGARQMEALCRILEERGRNRTMDGTGEGRARNGTARATAVGSPFLCPNGAVVYLRSQIYSDIMDYS
jgi:HPt (histidine-containing phosphotransfer) domain-containing protein